MRCRTVSQFCVPSIYRLWESSRANASASSIMALYSARRRTAGLAEARKARLQPGCSKNLTCGRKAPTTTCIITIVCLRGCIPASVRLLETLGGRRPFPACARIRQLATVTAKSTHGASTHTRKKARFASVSDHDVNAAAETSTGVSNPPFSSTFCPPIVYGKPAELVPGVGASAIVAVYHDGGRKCVVGVIGEGPCLVDIPSTVGRRLAGKGA